MLLAAAVAAFAAMSAASQAASTALTFADGTLHGTLLTPDTQKPGPAVLMIAGSGPTDRDGNSTVPGVRPQTFKLLAEGLAANGIASLRFDKRGIAASSSAMVAEQDLRLATYVDDAVGWAKLLAAQPLVSCVVILGHSEGALTGALAATKTKVCGYISVSGSSETLDAVLRRQYGALHSAGRLPDALWDRLQDILTRLSHGEQVEDVPVQFAAALRPSVQPYQISVMQADPLKAIAAVTAPVLILQGTHDLQIQVQDAKALAAANPRAKLVLLDGVNHVLKDAPADRAGNIATYADPNLPLDGKIVPTIAEFVRGLEPSR